METAWSPLEPGSVERVGVAIFDIQVEAPAGGTIVAGGDHPYDPEAFARSNVNRGFTPADEVHPDRRSSRGGRPEPSSAGTSVTVTTVRATGQPMAVEGSSWSSVSGDGHVDRDA